jgi:hypothetical protein
MPEVKELDERDQQILKEYQDAFLARTEPKQGDWVRFSDGTMRRIAQVWKNEENKPDSIQTDHSKFGSSFYLGNGYMSFSGGLFSGVPFSTFTRTNETKEANAWIFHHGHTQAHNGIFVKVLCPVWECSLQPNGY